MKIFINEVETHTDKEYAQHHDLMKLYGNGYSQEDLYHVCLENNDKYWEDTEIPIGITEPNALIKLQEGMKFKVFPKASYSNRA